MTKKQTNVTDNSKTVFVEDIKTKPVEEENFEYTNLNNALVETRKTDDVTGYILQSSTSATIDLDDQTKLTDYAMSTSAIIHSSKKIEKIFDVGTVENIIIEGKKTKTLCVIKGENKISVFMQKEANHSDIIQKIDAKAPAKTTP